MSLTTSSSAHAQPQKMPLLWGIGFVAALFILLVCTAMQVQSTEAWVLHQSTFSLTPYLGVYGQLAQFWTGGITQQEMIAYAAGWVVQATQLMLSFGIELPHEMQWRRKLFFWASVGLVAINSLLDYIYAAPFGVWDQVIFPIVLFVGTFCFGLVAIYCGLQFFKLLR